MEAVGAGLGSDVDDSAKREAVFGGHGTGLDFKFLHRVDGEVGVEVGVVAVGRDHAIDQHIVDGVGTAVDAPIAEAGAAVGESALNGSGVGMNVGGEQDEGERIASVEGQFLDVTVFDDLSDGAVFGVDDRRGTGDLDGFGDGSDIEADIDFGLLIDLQDDPGADGFLEAGMLGDDLIGADVQGGSGVETVLIGFGVDGAVGIDVDDGDFCAGDGGSAGIGDGTENGSAALLGHCWKRGGDGAAQKGCERYYVELRHGSSLLRARNAMAQTCPRPRMSFSLP